LAIRGLPSVVDRLPALTGHPTQQPDQPEVAEPMRQLGAEAGLELREQIERATVVGSVATPAERHHALRLVAAAQRPRHDVGWIDGSPAADETEPSVHLGPLFIRCSPDSAAPQGRPPL
jgi:hypothetical protein